MLLNWPEYCRRHATDNHRSRRWPKFRDRWSVESHALIGQRRDRQMSRTTIVFDGTVFGDDPVPCKLNNFRTNLNIQIAIKIDFLNYLPFLDCIGVHCIHCIRIFIRVLSASKTGVSMALMPINQYMNNSPKSLSWSMGSAFRLKTMWWAPLLLLSASAFMIPAGTGLMTTSCPILPSCKLKNMCKWLALLFS